MTASSGDAPRTLKNARIRKERGKYGARSCLQCRRRKVKCAGGFPCIRCISQEQDCDSPSRARAAESSDSANLAPSCNDPSAPSVQLLRRLTQLSGSMSALVHDAEHILADKSEGLQSPTSLPISHQATPSSGHLSSLDRHPSVANLSRVSATSTTQTGWTLLEDCFSMYDIEAKKDDWRCYLHTYFDEMHVFFPFIHPPSVWRTFEDLWSEQPPSSLNDLSQRESKTPLAIVFVCMAIGRCTISPRVRHTEDRHSSGWTLYNVGSFLLGDLLNLAKVPHKPCLAEVQALLLLTLYFFRLNINDRAQSLLAQASTRASILGMHKQRKLTTLSMFQSEMSIRTRCCLYMLDRLVSLETGLPYLILGRNSGVREPLALSDEFLETNRQDDRSSSQMVMEIKHELERSPATSVPFMAVCNTIAQFIGEIWDWYDGTWFDHPSATVQPSSNYWDARIKDAMRRIPTSMLYQASIPFESQFQGIDWWQKKQAMELYMRLSTIRYLLYRSDAAKDSETNNRACATSHLTKICGQQAAAIVIAFDSIPSSYPKYIAPFVWYLSSATIMLLSIVSHHLHLRENYSSTIRSALESLRICAASTWISGSVIKTLARLNTIARELGLGGDSSVEAESGNTTTGFLAESPALARSSTGLLNEALFYKAFNIQQPGSHEPREHITISSGASGARVPSSSTGDSTSGIHHLAQIEDMDHVSGLGLQQDTQQEVEDVCYEDTSDWRSSTWLPPIPDNLTFDPTDWILEDFMIQEE